MESANIFALKTCCWLNKSPHDIVTFIGAIRVITKKIVLASSTINVLEMCVSNNAVSVYYVPGNICSFAMCIISVQIHTLLGNT